jgi:putative tryptophan/tyrosine transport system substrate-binding protein
MRRRHFLWALGGAAVAQPLAVHAQQAAMPVVGYLGSESAERFGIRLPAFQQGLSAMGYDEGRSVTIEYRWAGGQTDRLPVLAADLVRRRVNVIAAPGSVVAALAAKAATTTIPIVFEMGLDPVAVKLVRSLNRPEANVTGITSLNVEVGPKRLELLHELLPGVKNFAVLVNPTNTLNTETTRKDLDGPSRALGVELHFLNAGTEREFEAAFASLAELRVGALIIASDIFFHSRARQLAELSLKHSVPAVLAVPEFAAAGGLISYGGDIRGSHRQAGTYTGRILKGEKPANLAVQQVTKLQLVINLRTAKALGIAVSLPLLGRADEVIE